MTAQRDLELLVRAVLPRRDEVAAEMLRYTLAELADVAHDDVLTDLLAASIADNLSTGLHAIVHGSDLTAVEAPQAAIEYARRLAQRGVPMATLLRAYRLGQGVFLQLAGTVLAAGEYADPAATMVSFVGQVSTYIDRISEQVATVYERERTLWVAGRAGLRQQAVARLLGSEPIAVAEIEDELDYRLDGWHLAVCAWIDPGVEGAAAPGILDRLGALLRDRSPGVDDLLLVPTDTAEVRMWLHATSAEDLDPQGVAALVADCALPVRVATGPVRHGVAGFRSGARLADRVRHLAAASPDPAPYALTHAEVALVTLLVEDREELGAFVRSVLGPLAAADERSAGLRETLEVFLACQRSYQAAAERLFVHRNTVHYRVQQALVAWGGALPDDVAAVQLALQVVRWHGVEAGR